MMIRGIVLNLFPQTLTGLSHEETELADVDAHFPKNETLENLRKPVDYSSDQT